MNRMEEYEALLAQLETVPISDPVSKAKKRQKRTNRVRRSMVSVAAAFCVFVGMINVSPAVSAACREIPFLKEVDRSPIEINQTRCCEMGFLLSLFSGCTTWHVGWWFPSQGLNL